MEGAVRDLDIAEADEVDLFGLNELAALEGLIGTERRRLGAGMEEDGRWEREGDGMGVALGSRALDAVESEPLLRTVVPPLAVLDSEWPRGLRIEDTDGDALVDLVLSPLSELVEETRVEDCEKRVEVSEGVDGVPLKDVGGSASDLLSPAAISLLECSRERKVEVWLTISSMRRWLRLAVRGSRAG